MSPEKVDIEMLTGWCSGLLQTGRGACLFCAACANNPPNTHHRPTRKECREFYLNVPHSVHGKLAKYVLSFDLFPLRGSPPSKFIVFFLFLMRSSHFAQPQAAHRDTSPLDGTLLGFGT